MRIIVNLELGHSIVVVHGDSDELRHSKSHLVAWTWRVHKAPLAILHQGDKESRTVFLHATCKQLKKKKTRKEETDYWQGYD